MLLMPSFFKAQIVADGSLSEPEMSLPSKLKYLAKALIPMPPIPMKWSFFALRFCF